MINKLFVFLTILAFSSFASFANVHIEVSKDTISTGEIVSAHFIFDADSAQTLSTVSLKGKTLSETLYVQSISPLVRKEGSAEFTADGEVIFISSPENNELYFEAPGKKIRFFWNNVRINALETPKDYLIGQFSIPDPLQLLKWLGILVLTLLLGYGGYILKKKYDRKKTLRLELLSLSSRIKGCQSYGDVVELWKSKRIIIERFPHTAQSFEKLENVLFRYQFKPTQTLEEQQRVMEAYKGFLSETEGGLNGV